MEVVEKISDDFILPIIKHINDPNQSEIFDREKLKGGIVLVESLVSETSDLNNSLDEFCVKYKLPKKMSDFEKKDYAEKIKALKSKTSG